MVVVMMATALARLACLLLLVWALFVHELGRRHLYRVTPIYIYRDTLIWGYSYIGVHLHTSTPAYVGIPLNRDAPI